jgi:tetratricopeptide (TPR) repeat protein
MVMVQNLWNVGGRPIAVGAPHRLGRDKFMRDGAAADYLSGLPSRAREELVRVNAQGLSALRGYLSTGSSVAFLGAGISAPLYPLWPELVCEIVDSASDKLRPWEAATCRSLATQSPEEVMEIVRQQLGPVAYRQVLREVLRTRTDPASGRSWTPSQELVCRCAFQAIVTTNYDLGIVDARMRVRSRAAVTGFMTWEDEDDLDRWRTREVFEEEELPVLFAHGQSNRPDGVVLAANEYRRAYAGKLPKVLGRLVDSGHIVWLGFSFADQRIVAILREIAAESGPKLAPGGTPRHVAVMPWDPAAEGNDPGVLARRAEIGYGARAVLYPAPSGDHSALARLLSDLTDARYPSVPDLPDRPATKAIVVSAGGRVDAEDVRVAWVPGPDRIEHFTGRAEELARLDRWAGDPHVSVVGVTAWGGAGKTALVTQWVQASVIRQRPVMRAAFGWSFYSDSSAEHWAAALLDWGARSLGVSVTAGRRPASAVLALMRAVPVLLILDGLEVAQEGPAGDGFGRLLDGTLREVLTGACQQSHEGLILLTSRFPFADLEAFDGGSVRVLDVPPLTPAEGSALLSAAGGSWLPDIERQALVAAVDGHALATSVLAGLLADHLPADDLTTLRRELAAATRTSARVDRVLRFYKARVSEPDRYLLAAVSLFTRPVSAQVVLTVVRQPAFRANLAGWTAATVQAAVVERLGGLLSWYPNGTISAHPLIRDTFRPLVLGAAQTAAEITLTGVPAGEVTTRADALRVVEAIELLLDADLWQPADDLYENRTSMGYAWKNLPAARLGQRAATAFVGTPARQAACDASLSHPRLGYYLNSVGLFAMLAGDIPTARDFLNKTVRHHRDADDLMNLSICLLNLAECLEQVGQSGQAIAVAKEAFTLAETASDAEGIRDCYAHLGWLTGLCGDIMPAERCFAAAEKIKITDDPSGTSMYGLRGIRWAEWLARTGRSGPARALTVRNRELCGEFGRALEVARCDRVLGRLAILTADTKTARRHLLAAAQCFRDSDYLTELAATLTDLADYARVTNDHEAAELYVTEAINIASPRHLIPAQSAALAARARNRAARAAAASSGLSLDRGSTDPTMWLPLPQPTTRPGNNAAAGTHLASPVPGGRSGHIVQGRDAADAALRLATLHGLPWHQLDALFAHAALDAAEANNHGWAAKASELHGRLISPELVLKQPVITARAANRNIFRRRFDRRR